MHEGTFLVLKTRVVFSLLRLECSGSFSFYQVTDPDIFITYVYTVVDWDRENGVCLLIT